LPRDDTTPPVTKMYLATTVTANVERPFGVWRSHFGVRHCG
jgi:hypothetical protein